MLHHHSTLSLSKALLATAVLDSIVAICGYVSFANTVTLFLNIIQLSPQDSNVEVTLHITQLLDNSTSYPSYFEIHI